MNMTPEHKATMDQILVDVDDELIAQGRTPLSVLVVHDDGVVSTAFWQTVRKHGLRLPGESDTACVARFRAKAFAEAKL